MESKPQFCLHHTRTTPRRSLISLAPSLWTWVSAFVLTKSPNSHQSNRLFLVATNLPGQRSARGKSRTIWPRGVTRITTPFFVLERDEVSASDKFDGNTKIDIGYGNISMWFHSFFTTCSCHKLRYKDGFLLNWYTHIFTVIQEMLVFEMQPVLLKEGRVNPYPQKERKKEREQNSEKKISVN